MDGRSTSQSFGRPSEVESSTAEDLVPRPQERRGHLLCDCDCDLRVARGQWPESRGILLGGHDPAGSTGRCSVCARGLGMPRTMVRAHDGRRGIQTSKVPTRRLFLATNRMLSYYVMHLSLFTLFIKKFFIVMILFRPVVHLFYCTTV